MTTKKEIGPPVELQLRRVQDEPESVISSEPVNRDLELLKLTVSMKVLADPCSLLLPQSRSRSRSLDSNLFFWN